MTGIRGPCALPCGELQWTEVDTRLSNHRQVERRGLDCDVSGFKTPGTDPKRALSLAPMVRSCISVPHPLRCSPRLLFLHFPVLALLFPVCNFTIPSFLFLNVESTTFDSQSCATQAKPLSVLLSSKQIFSSFPTP